MEDKPIGNEINLSDVKSKAMGLQSEGYSNSEIPEKSSKNQSNQSLNPAASIYNIIEDKERSKNLRGVLEKLEQAQNYHWEFIRGPSQTQGKWIFFKKTNENLMNESFIEIFQKIPQHVSF